MKDYDPHAALLTAIMSPQPDPIVVDRETVGVFLGLSARGTRKLFEKHHDKFRVIGHRRHGPGRPRSLYDLRQVADAYDRLKNGADNDVHLDPGP